MADNTSSGKSSMKTTIIVIVVLTLIGAGTGLAVGALLGVPAPSGEIKVEAPKVDPPGASHGDSEAKKVEPKKEASGSNHGETAGDAAVLAAFEVPPPADLEVSLAVVPLEPIVTNLAAPDGVWVRIEASLLVRQDEAEAQEVLAAEAAAGMLAYLRTLTLQDIEGASGFLAFRDDLDDLVRSISHGAASKVLIKSLVVE